MLRSSAQFGSEKIQIGFVFSLERAQVEAAVGVDDLARTVIEVPGRD